ncbi:MAG: hypothetical protein ABJD11_18920 [Gemmatimonadota bacterium]
MIIGHYGIAFALKRVEPRISLAALFVATQLVDILWLFFVLIGLEHVTITPGFSAASPMEFTDYPITHSLVAAVCWALFAGAVYYSWPTKDVAHHRRRTVFIMLAVASHWVLDFIVHTPDLPISDNDSLKVGLGLWRSIPATTAVELLVFGGGLALWMLSAHRRRPSHPVRVGLLAVVLVALFIAAMASPPPSSVHSMVVWGLVGLPLLLLFAWWADLPIPEQTRMHEHPHTHGRK